MARLSNRPPVALITGASLGVGRACARAFFAQGAHVVLVARRPGPLQTVAEALGSPERVWTRAVDVTDLAAMAAVVEEVETELGGVDVLVNNAGAHFRGRVIDRDPDELARMVDVNLRAPVALTRMVLPGMLDRGRGNVVQVASLAGKIPLDGAATYSCTKWGLRTFSFALAEELAGTPVNVSVVSPGPIDTGFILDDLESVPDITFSQTMCSAEHVAQMVLDCAADGARERAWPPSGGRLATLAYLMPSLRRWLRPRLEAKGARAKAALRKRLEAGTAPGEIAS